MQAILTFYLSQVANCSPQVNQEIYSEEDLLAIDSSPQEYIDQLAVETNREVQATVVLPPASFRPTGGITRYLKHYKQLLLKIAGGIQVAENTNSRYKSDGSYSFRFVEYLVTYNYLFLSAFIRIISKYDFVATQHLMEQSEQNLAT